VIVELDAKTVKKLRDMTGSGMMDCKRALKEAGGDIEKAVDVLRKKGIAKAGARAARATEQGRIETYVHLGARLGVMLELKCETDFVARNDEFINLARDLCMHVAAMRPIAVDRENVPPELLEREKNVYRESEDLKSKPENIREKIVEGRMKKFYTQNVLLEQSFVKDEKTSVGDYMKQHISKFGENITVGRFVRFELGESTGSAASDKESEE
jgi:elongation factor Ts